MDIIKEKIDIPEGVNVILGQTHFIKSAEDIYEVIINTNPNIKFGFAFCEASQKCLVRYEGNDDQLKKLAAENALKIAAGHFFIIYLKEGYPINILTRLKQVPEVCTIFCATANPVTVLCIEVGDGRGIIGVVDGLKSKGIEKEEDIVERRKFLRDIGYKF